MSLKKIAASTILFAILTPVCLALGAWTGNSIIDHGKDIRELQTDVKYLQDLSKKINSIDRNIKKLLKRK